MPFSQGRTSYLQWREDLKKLHASTVTGIMKDVGYSTDSCGKVIGSSTVATISDRRSRNMASGTALYWPQVEAMILKKSLKSNPDAQIVEDALCLGT